MVSRRFLLIFGLLCALSAHGLVLNASHAYALTGGGAVGDGLQAFAGPGGISDLDITQRIRRAILEDDSLSIYAQNVKIITQQGIVTLKGIVRSAAERDSVEQKARAVVGTTNVRNEIEVAASTTVR